MNCAVREVTDLFTSRNGYLFQPILESWAGGALHCRAANGSGTKQTNTEKYPGNSMGAGQCAVTPQHLKLERKWNSQKVGRSKLKGISRKSTLRGVELQTHTALEAGRQTTYPLNLAYLTHTTRLLYPACKVLNSASSDMGGIVKFLIKKKKKKRENVE